MNLELENLIELALANGTLSDKGKQVLYRKAQEFNVDIDEFEMILEGKIHFRQKELQKESEVKAALISTPPLPTHQQFKKEVEIKKCPLCGSPIQSFKTNCPDCGYEFINHETNSSMEKLFGMLQNAKSTEEKSSIIINFPVPNTKEAIVEFLTQAISGSKADNSSALGKTGRVLAGLYTLGVSELIKKAMKSEVQSLAPAWRTKCEQIIIKARFSMKEDRETLNEINRFAIELGIK